MAAGMSPVDAVRGESFPMLWWMCLGRSLTLCQYRLSVMRFCCGGSVVGLVVSNVAGDGMGAVSSVRRDVLMAWQKVSGVKSGCGVGAMSMSVQIGVRAWCRTCAAVYRVSVRCLLEHSMWRCGVFSFLWER